VDPARLSRSPHALRAPPSLPTRRSSDLLFRYHEILPGLGAFALRPHRDGEAQGLGAVRGFLSAVLDHVATQVSQHERHRYWEREIFAEAPPDQHKADAVPFLTRPPENTRVLLGYVRDDAHYR